jgi:hypothetical protein
LIYSCSTKPCYGDENAIPISNSGIAFIWNDQEFLQFLQFLPEGLGEVEGVSEGVV